MKNLSDLTWQDAAIIELKSILQHVEHGDAISGRQLDHLTGAVRRYNAEREQKQLQAGLIKASQAAKS